VLVTEADDTGRAIPGRDVVESRGGRVVVLAAEHGWSTTSIIEQIQRQTRS
jgi:bifunctional ADP-heptose synthase (sugar kinase/adenylyltransferase)